MPTNRPSRSPAALIVIAALALPALGQQAENQVWPEGDFFVNLNQSSRLFVMVTGTRIEEQGNTDGTFGIHYDLFTSPLFKKRLEPIARRADIAKNKFMLIRVGYLYSHSSKHSTSQFTEHTPTIEYTHRYYFAKQILFSARSRGDLRFLNGVFTPRYRQRAKIERTFKLTKTAVTPYVHAEAFYDPRYMVFHLFRYSVGAEWELNKHVVLESYYVRQRDNRSSTRFMNAAGFSVQFYFR